MDSSHSVWRGNAGRNISLLASAVEDHGTSRAASARDQEDRLEPLRVGIIDRDSGFLVVLCKRLERLGWQQQTLALDTTERELLALELDVLIVDLAGLGKRRWEWLERLCAAGPPFGIIVCTGASTVQERVRALRLGADDWLGKPCHAEELIARIESIAAARRAAPPRDLEPVTIGEVEIRPGMFQAFVDDVSLELTPREFQLIELLGRAGGEILEREAIYERLWGYEMARNDRSVDVFVHKLRRKLKQASPAWSYIQTEFRVGYRLIAKREDATPPVELRPRREQPVPLAA
jgi:DNA-binding response OmpR family regulator